MTKRIPVEQLVMLYNQLEMHTPRSKARSQLVVDFAISFGVSANTVYRQLNQSLDITTHKRKDCNQPRAISKNEMLMYCRLIAALKIRTCNKKGRHLSTPRCIAILEEHGVETENGLIKTPKGLLKKTTINRYLLQWGFEHKAMREIEPTVVHFEAEHSNDCWQFDFSPSDLKQLQNSADQKLFIVSVTDDKSGVLYSEYVESKGEDALTALNFLFKAMSVKKTQGMSFQGIPKLIYTDNGAFAKSVIFQRALAALGIELKTHLPKGRDGRRTTARAKGKVERTNRTLKESFETLFHLHQPSALSQANEWLMNYLRQYNDQPHRSEKLSRMSVWQRFLPSEGYRQMCSWEKFCQIVRKPEERLVGSDACVVLDGVKFQLLPDMAGNQVILLFGVFDNELYVEFNGEKLGPFYPCNGPIPLHTFRQFPKSKQEKRADDIFKLAQTLSVPLSVMTGKVDHSTVEQLTNAHAIQQKQNFVAFAEEKFQEFENRLVAKQAISQFLDRPLAELTHDQIRYINEVIDESLNKQQVLSKIKNYFTLTLCQMGEN